MSQLLTNHRGGSREEPFNLQARKSDIRGSEGPGSKGIILSDINKEISS